MHCSACAFENPPGTKFCGNCTHPLTLACPSCGVENPPSFKFCGQCTTPLGSEGKVEGAIPVRDPRAYTPKHLADKILTSRSALEGERKQVTIVFADVRP